MPSQLELPPEEVEIPFSILDTDLYKVCLRLVYAARPGSDTQLTMQNAVLRHFPDAHVTIKFTNRAPHMLFSRDCFDWVQEHVNRARCPRAPCSERSCQVSES